MNKVWVSFLFILLTLNVVAQNKLQQLDSTYQYCIQHPLDSLALYNFASQQYALFPTHPDTLIFYARELSEFAQSNGYSNIRSRAFLTWGGSLESIGELDSAIGMFKTALNIAEIDEHEDEIVDAYNSLGFAYSQKGLYELSIEVTLKAVELLEGSEDSVKLANLLNNAGMRFEELGRYSSALNFYRLAHRLNMALDDSIQVAVNCINLGNTYYHVPNHDSSQYFFNRGLSLGIATRNRNVQMQAYGGLANLNLAKQDFEVLKVNIDSLHSIALEINNQYGIHYAWQMIASMYKAQGNCEKALPILEEEIRWFYRSQYMINSLRILKSLAECYSATGQNAKAYNAMKRYATASDSVQARQKNLAIEQISVYREQRREKERNLLQNEISLRQQELEYQTNLRNTFFVIGALVLLIALFVAYLYNLERNTKKQLASKNQIIQFEKQRSDELLLNILPSDVADELKDKGRSEARLFDEVTVIFTDFANFTEVSQNMSAHDMVEDLNQCFRAFDEIITKWDLEKIKTIGDAYMAAGGLYHDDGPAVKEAVRAALEMQEFIINREYGNKDGNGPHFISMRCGLHTGSVVAGIVGVKKFQYDIWGDTVNTASRMETHGELGRVNISQTTYEFIKDDPDFEFEPRGKIDVKGKGQLEMYFVNLKSHINSS